MSYGPTLGFLAAGYRTYATRHEYRWPFLGPMISTPEEKRWGGFWDGERMRFNMGKTEVGQGLGVEGRRMLMHLVRGSSYAAMGVFVGGLLMGTYGLTVTAVGEARDERFAAVRRVMREQVEGKRRETERRRGELVGPKEGMAERGRAPEQEEEEVVGLVGAATGFEQQQPQSQGGRDRVYGQGGREAGDLWSRHREKIQRGAARGQTDVDDASPTSGMGMLDFGEGEEMRTGTPEAEDSSMRSGIQSSRRSRRRMDAQQDRNRDTPNRAGQDSDSTLDDGLSAWERIRRGADSAGPADTGVAPPPSPMRTSGRRPRRDVRAQKNGDGNFAFSSSDQERSYAQSDAQDEFDKRLEQERRGGDFSESGQTGWSGRRG